MFTRLPTSYCRINAGLNGFSRSLATASAVDAGELCYRLWGFREPMNSP
jgi:hypothetical protein